MYATITLINKMDKNQQTHGDIMCNDFDLVAAFMSFRCCNMSCQGWITYVQSVYKIKVNNILFTFNSKIYFTKRLQKRSKPQGSIVMKQNLKKY